jgi:hypothetical protein
VLAALSDLWMCVRCKESVHGEDGFECQDCESEDHHEQFADSLPIAVVTVDSAQ